MICLDLSEDEIAEAATNFDDMNIAELGNTNEERMAEYDSWFEVTILAKIDPEAAASHREQVIECL